MTIMTNILTKKFIFPYYAIMTVGIVLASYALYPMIKYRHFHFELILVIITGLLIQVLCVSKIRLIKHERREQKAGLPLSDSTEINYK